MTKEDVRLPFDFAMFSGRITAKYPANPDKHGNMKISFTLALKKAGKAGKQSYAHLILYDLELAKEKWFKVGTYVYTQSRIRANGFYVVEVMTCNSHDCYNSFIQRVYEEMKYEEDEGPDEPDIKGLLGGP